MNRSNADQLGQFRHNSHCYACVHHPNCTLWLSLLRADDGIDDANRLLFSPDLTKPCGMFFPRADALNLQDIKSKVLEDTLDALTTSVYLTDSRGHIVYMNRAAEDQVKKGDTLRAVDNRLTPVDRLARITLAKAVAEVAVYTTKRPSGVTVALPCWGKEGLIASVIPIEGPSRNDLCAGSVAMAAIFVQDSNGAAPLPGHAFGQLYGLTDAELRVVLVMAPGLGAKEAAKLLGISHATVRTHLKHIYDKTGTSKQTELMRLFLTSTPPTLN